MIFVEKWEDFLCNTVLHIEFNFVCFRVGYFLLQEIRKIFLRPFNASRRCCRFNLSFFAVLRNQFSLCSADTLMQLFPKEAFI